MFSGVIEQVHDQIATRLGNINAMLSQLSLGEATAGIVDSEPPPLAPEDVQRFAIVANSIETPIPDEPNVGGHAETLPGGRFERFVRQVEDNDLEAASQTLTELLEVDPRQALRCAERFRQQFERSPTLTAKSEQLRRELAGGQVNGPLMLLWECFGLQGPQAVEALQALRSQLHRW